jgi:hypothetical protein
MAQAQFRYSLGTRNRSFRNASGTNTYLASLSMQLHANVRHALACVGLQLRLFLSINVIGCLYVVFKCHLLPISDIHACIYVQLCMENQPKVVDPLHSPPPQRRGFVLKTLARFRFIYPVRLLSLVDLRAGGLG